MKYIFTIPITVGVYEEKQATPYGHGPLDAVFSIFKARQHPIILVEEAAFRWMGLRVYPIEVQSQPLAPAGCSLLPLTDTGSRPASPRLGSRHDQGRSHRNRAVQASRAESRIPA
jgi:hypothetical protein